MKVLLISRLLNLPMENEYLSLPRLFHEERAEYVAVGGYAVIARKVFFNCLLPVGSISIGASTSPAEPIQ